MEKTLVFSSDPKGTLVKCNCPDCEETFMGSSDVEYCPYCYSSVNHKGKAKLKSSSAPLSKVVFCSSCNGTIYSNTKEDPEDLANNIFCPLCGDADVECETEDKPEKKEKKEKKVKEDDDDVEEKEELESKLKETDTSSLEAALITQPEETWYFFKNGDPLFRLVKSKVHSDSHTIFASDKFLDIFQQRAKEISVASAIKEFDGEILNKNEIFNSLDLENLAFERLRSHFVPKFVDCLGLAIEGASKGVYPNLNSDLKAAFFDELVARGLVEKDAHEAIESAFYSAGTDVFSSMISKALELFNKDSKTFNEVKATIQSSGVVKSRTTSEEDLERKEFKSRLVGGNLPIQDSEPISGFSKREFNSTSVDDYRQKISFRK